MNQQPPLLLDLVHERIVAGLDDAIGSRLLHLLGAWFGVLEPPGARESHSGIPSFSDIVEAGLEFAVFGNERAKSSFVSSIPRLRGRSYFTPNQPQGLEGDPVALFALAVGLVAVNENTDWLLRLLDEALLREKDDMRRELLVLANAVLKGSVSSWNDVAPLLKLAAQSAGLLDDSPQQVAALSELYYAKNLSVEWAIFHAAALKALASCVDLQLPRVEKVVALMRSIPDAMGLWPVDVEEGSGFWVVQDAQGVQRLAWTVLRPVFPGTRIIENIPSKVGSRNNLCIPQLGVVLGIHYIPEYTNSTGDKLLENIKAEVKGYLTEKSLYHAYVPLLWSENPEFEAEPALSLVRCLPGVVDVVVLSGPNTVEIVYEPIETEGTKPMQDFHVGIITMKEEEFEAVLDKFEPDSEHEGKRRSYEVSIIKTPKGPCRVAITRCAQQGNLFAQAAASEMIGDISPSFILVVGIAGGVPTVDFCLGDVLVSSSCVDLTIEDTGSGVGKRRFDASGGLLHTSATRVVERLKSIERRATGWNDAGSIACPRPDLTGSFTTENTDWNEGISEALTRLEQRTAPIATAKKIASSDRLVKDPELISQWRTVLKGVSAVEMEFAGVYVLCQREDIPVLAIRGISDVVGWERDEAWTLYACHTAAAYVRALTQQGVFLTEQP
tara:strand:- start:4256 stop:6259 length:2004 start_codon:yes stop_codon:yes gene_type:complete